MSATRICNGCGTAFPCTAEFFPKNGHRKGVPNFRGICRRCERDRALQRDYGIDIADYEARVRAQSNLCAICGRPPSTTANGGQLLVDHCHASGRVRALLCHTCNHGLGNFQDSRQLLVAAVQYLQAHPAVAVDRPHRGPPSRQKQP